MIKEPKDRNGEGSKESCSRHTIGNNKIIQHLWVRKSTGYSVIQICEYINHIYKYKWYSITQN